MHGPIWKKIHKYFYTRINEMTLTDPTSIKQHTGESIVSYIQRFKDTHSQCFTLDLSNQQLKELAF
jgi:hypothetical protein